MDSQRQDGLNSSASRPIRQERGYDRKGFSFEAGFTERTSVRDENAYVFHQSRWTRAQSISSRHARKSEGLIVKAHPPIEFSATNIVKHISQKNVDMIILAVVVFVLFLILASAAKTLVQRFSQRKLRRPNFALLLGQLVHGLVAILGFLIALSIAAPSFRAGDLIKMLGIGTVAIGFAFQNILQNFLAGILLLLQEPFQLGD